MSVLLPVNVPKKQMSEKQCRHWSDIAFCCVWSGQVCVWLWFVPVNFQVSHSCLTSLTFRIQNFKVFPYLFLEIGLDGTWIKYKTWDFCNKWCSVEEKGPSTEDLDQPVCHDNLIGAWVKISADNILKYFLWFTQKIVFEMSCKTFP